MLYIAVRALTCKSRGLEGGDHSRYEGLNGIRESVVSQRDARIAATNGILVKANAVSNGVSSIVLPVKRIDGGLDDVVAQRAESRQDLAIGSEVRWPHISGKDADDR
jgi:hypothetical protein